MYRYSIRSSLQWRHNERNGVSNHQPHDCLLNVGVSYHQLYDCLFNRLFRRRSKKTSKLRVTGGCDGNSPVTGEFTAQRASNAANVPFDDVIMDYHSNGRCHGAKECQVAPCWFQRHLSIKFLALSLLSGVPDLWDRNKILSGGDLSHYQVPHCIRILFYFVCFTTLFCIVYLL